MRRSKPLRADPEKVREFVRRGQQNAKLARSALSRSAEATAGRRSPVRTALRAKPKPRSEREKELRARWDRAAGMARRCEACKRAGRGLDGHHPLRRQTIERLARSAGLDVLAWAWDLGWQMPLHRACHEPHTNRSQRIGAERVPARAWQTAAALDEALAAAGNQPVAVRGVLREHPGEAPSWLTR